MALTFFFGTRERKITTKSDDDRFGPCTYDGGDPSYSSSSSFSSKRILGEGAGQTRYILSRINFLTSTVTVDNVRVGLAQRCDRFSVFVWPRMVYRRVRVLYLTESRTFTLS